MTTPLELKTRALADEYMQTHPGVPRQEAKRRVRGRAKLLVAVEQAHAAFERLAVASAPTWRRMTRELGRSVRERSGS